MIRIRNVGKSDVRTCTVLRPAELLAQVYLVGGDRSHDDVTVTIHVLGQGVVSQVCPQLQGAAKVGRQESVVH